MPPIGTSSPFRVPPRPNPSRPNRSPHFASTPRFILSQDTPRREEKDDIDTDEPPFSTPVTSAQWTSTWHVTGSAPRRNPEVIEDPEEDLSQKTSAEQDRRCISDAGIDSSPAEEAGAVDAEFDLLFGSAFNRAKRRRVSLERDIAAETVDTPSLQRGKSRFEPILSSSPEPPSPQRTSPIPRREEREPGVSNRMPTTTAASASSTGTPKISASTPGTINRTTITTPFRTHHPRFMLSATQQFPSTQSQLNPTPGDQSPPSKRKPGFVLPRSPSPSELCDNDPSTIPTPFSPTSRTLQRRGRRSRAGNAQGQDYLPGGMASEVRSWILEMGTKRELQHQRRALDSSVPVPDARRYFLLGRVRKMRQGALGSSGPVLFVEVMCEDGSDECDSRSRLRNILLFGVPRSNSGLVPESHHIPDLQPDSLVGVYKGLVWEIELDDATDSRPGSESGNKQKWLVCMEWDLIE